ncbi:hypothetical protein L6452_15248 [Arctium lappa]|uniref:Uncharacterized protein n=1 Tax=Arctium lappa TaxID=4217 RepID=A0ACB9CNH4_ARCLA|nr:hypothetical protein L6452_15248 [Arctium lappa]
MISVQFVVIDSCVTIFLLVPKWDKMRRPYSLERVHVNNPLHLPSFAICPGWFRSCQKHRSNPTPHPKKSI